MVAPYVVEAVTCVAVVVVIVGVDLFVLVSSTVKVASVANVVPPPSFVAEALPSLVPVYSFQVFPLAPCSFSLIKHLPSVIFTSRADPVQLSRRSTHAWTQVEWVQVVLAVAGLAMAVPGVFGPMSSIPFVPFVTLLQSPSASSPSQPTEP